MTPRVRPYRSVTSPDFGFLLRLLMVVVVLGASCSVDSGSLEASLNGVEVLGTSANPTAVADPADEPFEAVSDNSDKSRGSDDGESTALGFRLLPEAEAARRAATVGFELGDESAAADDVAENDDTEGDNTADDELAETPEPDASDDADAGDVDESDPDTEASVTDSPAAPESSAPQESADAAPSSSNGTINDLPWGPGGSVWVATAKPETGYVQVFDGSDGTPIMPKYQYLDGSVTDYPMWNPTFFGGPLSLMVVNGEPQDGYVEVQLPIRPTGSTGWVRTAEFDFVSNDYYVEIDIGTNRVRAWRGEELIVETAAVTGRSDRPTPLVRTYIDEKLPGPNPAYGPWMLTLAAFSDSLNTFGSSGGLPKIAMHGTNAPQLMGQYASSGCIRLPNDIITMLAETVPVGTRVDIVRT